MKNYILIIFTSLLLFNCSKSNEEIMKDTVKSYLSQSHKENSGYTYELKNIDIKLDTIPEYFNVVLEGSSTEASAANKAVTALGFLRRLNSPDAKLGVQMTGQPYSMAVVGGDNYYEDDAYKDLDNLESKLKSAKQNTVPAVEYIAYVVEKFRFPNDTEDRETKYVIVLDKNDPTKIIKSYDFYGRDIDEIAAVKFVQAQGNLKTDTFGRFDTSDWYNVEKFILSDRLNGDIIQLLGFDK